MKKTPSIMKPFAKIMCAFFAGTLFCVSAVAQQLSPQAQAAASALSLVNNSGVQGIAPNANFQIPAPQQQAAQPRAVPTSNNAQATNNGLLPPSAISGENTTAAATTNSLPPDPEMDPAVIQAARDQAFNQLTLNTLPMTAEQIQKLRNLFADSQRAATAAPGGVPPKAVASTQLVSLDPGSTPPIIRLAQGYVTSIVFLDATGAPWPLQSYDIGNPGAFNIQWDRTSNILMIQSSALYTTGNLVVQLKGLNTPVTLSLIPGQPIVDYRTDLRIQGLGPNAKPALSTPLPAAASNVLVNVLDGVSPNGKAQTLNVPGSASQAWLLGDKMYLRTHLSLLSPAWIASMTSADGTNAYEIPKVPSILVADNDGKIFNLRIEGY